MAEEKWLSTGEVAQLLHVEPITVWRLAKDGKLSYRKTPGGHRRYDPAVVRAFMAATDEGEQPDAP